MRHCQLRMELPNEAPTVPLCCRTAQALLEDLAIDAARAADIALVLSEAAGSLVRHARTPLPHRYRVTLTVFTDRVRLEVADEGCGFDRAAGPAPDAPPLAGRALWLIEQRADLATVSTLPDGGCLLEAEFFLPHPLVLRPPISDDPERLSPAGPLLDAEPTGPYHA